jgi:hypothetical protein
MRLSLIATSLAVAMLAQPGTGAPKKAAAPATVTVAPDIRKALERMAEAMKAMQSFEVRADTTSEEVLESGQKIQSSGVLAIGARRPDRFYINLDSERRKRNITYDGKQVTIYAPVAGYFATVPAPSTTRATLDMIAEHYGVETPLADLFTWGADGVKTDRVKSSLYAGPDQVGGAVCDHYAFRQTGVDWQIWIAKEGQPLPCKLVIVNTDDPSQPQTIMTFTWSPSAQIAESRFQFTAPASAHRIEIGKIQTAAAKGGSQ